MISPRLAAALMAGSWPGDALGWVARSAAALIPGGVDRAIGQPFGFLSVNACSTIRLSASLLVGDGPGCRFLHSSNRSSHFRSTMMFIRCESSEMRGGDTGLGAKSVKACRPYPARAIIPDACMHHRRKEREWYAKRDAAIAAVRSTRT